MKILFLLLSFYVSPSWAFIHVNNGVTEKNTLTLGVGLDAGKLEPHSDKASYQRSDVKYYNLGYGRSLGSYSIFKDSYLSTRVSYFESKREEKAGNIFHESDKGFFTDITFSWNAIHEVSHILGFSVKTNAIRDVNENKFSNPRIDLFGIGTHLGVQLSPSLASFTQFYFGSGVPNDINAALAVTQLFILENNKYLPESLKLQVGPYIEVDLTEREDPNYDEVYSPNNNRDKVRSAKVGAIINPSYRLNKTSEIDFLYVQKFTGVDAKNTQHYSLNYKIFF